jgi:hypothetical protein
MVSHVPGDALYPALRGDAEDLTFLLWPVLPVPDPEVAQRFGAHAAAVEPGRTLGFELLLVGLALVVWHDDGHPGLGVLRRGAIRGVRRIAAAVRAR